MAVITTIHPLDCNFGLPGLGAQYAWAPNPAVFAPDGALQPNVQRVDDYHGHEWGVRHAPAGPHFDAGGTAYSRQDKAYKPECAAIAYVCAKCETVACACDKTPVRTVRNGAVRSVLVSAITRAPLRDHDGRLQDFDSVSYRDSHECSYFDPLFLRTLHVGRVVGEYERNGRDDSDFYAIVALDGPCAADGCGCGYLWTHIEYASTRGWTYPNSAKVDATPEVAAAWEAHNARLAAAAQERRNAEACERAARTFDRGCAVELVRNVRGKCQCSAGERGTVFWIGRDKFSGADRIGVELAGRKVFIAADAARRV